MESTVEARKISVQVDGRLIRRIERLIEEPALGFISLEYFAAAALHSFIAFKEREIGRLRADAAGARP